MDQRPDRILTEISFNCFGIAYGRMETTVRIKLFVTIKWKAGFRNLFAGWFYFKNHWYWVLAATAQCFRRWICTEDSSY